MSYNAQLQAHTLPFPTFAIPTNLLRVGSVCGLGPDILGIRTLSLAAWYTFDNGLGKIQAAREYDHAPIHALSSEWKEKFLIPSVAHNTAEANEIVCRLDHNGKLDESQWPSQSLSHCTDSFPDETCVTCFSAWANCWSLTHPLQWSVYGTKTSR